jgi:hypothetical protein
MRGMGPTLEPGGGGVRSLPGGATGAIMVFLIASSSMHVTGLASDPLSYAVLATSTPSVPRYKHSNGSNSEGPMY